MGSKLIKYASVMIAVFGVSFTTKTKGVGTNCNDHLYYFVVKATISVDCTTITSLSQIELVAETSNPAQPNELLFVLSGAFPFFCSDEPEFACAVGYFREQIELVNGFWQPKTFSGVLVPKKCCIRRPF